MMDMPNEYSITIDADHFEMNKFTNRMDIGYRKIVLHILQTMKDTFSEAYNLGQFCRFNERLDICQLTVHSSIQDER